MNDNYILHDGQLYHHGIKGMKWGVRRFQRQDGSLTPAGQKRYNDGNGNGGGWKAKIEARRKKRAQEKIDNAYRKKRVEDLTPEELEAANKRAKLEREHRAIRPDTWKTESEAKAEAKAEAEAKKSEHRNGKQIHKKSVEDMTTEELASAIERARLEDTYRSLRPTEMSKGQKFAESVKGIAIKIAEEEGKNFVSKLGDKLLEKYFPSTKKDLETLAKEANLEKVKAETEKIKQEARKAKYDADDKAPKKPDATDSNPSNDKAPKKPDATDSNPSNDKQSGNKSVGNRQSGARNFPNLPSGDGNKKSSSTSKSNKTSSADPDKETYKVKPEDIITDPSPKKTSEPSSKPKYPAYDAPIVSTYVDKSAGQSTSVVTRNSSDIANGKSYVSGYLDTPIAGLLPGPV